MFAAMKTFPFVGHQRGQHFGTTCAGNFIPIIFTLSG